MGFLLENTEMQWTITELQFEIDIEGDNMIRYVTRCSLCSLRKTVGKSVTDEMCPVSKLNSLR